MSIWQTIIIITGLTLDVFAYCLYKGAMISEVHKGQITKVVSIFTGFQVGMMVIGTLITRVPAIREKYISANRLWTLLAAVTFFALGTVMIIKSARRRGKKIEEQKQDGFNFHIIVFWAFLTSIDALIAGIGFGFMGLRLLGTLAIMAIITAAGAIAGFTAGYWLGCSPMNKFITIGGCLVLFGGTNLLVNYLTYIF